MIYPYLLTASELVFIVMLYFALNTFVLKTNVPNGMKDAKNPINVLTIFSSPFAVCDNSNTMKLKNNTPCIGPIILTASGIPAKYFNGTAMPTKSSKDVPSKRAAQRRILKSGIFFILKDELG